MDGPAAAPGRTAPGNPGPAARAFRRSMDLLYLLCILISGGSLVVISVIVPWGVYTRYVLNSASSWPEPLSILLTILLTFFGSAACYRIGMHMRVEVVRRQLPLLGRRAASLLSELLVGLLAVFMIIDGTGLVHATWYDEVPSFPFLWVGLTYLPIPVGGAFLLAFVFEHLLIGPPPATEQMFGADASL
jgi:TRAP-type C4-dicarboxylate transport system permease small subunit